MRTATEKGKIALEKNKEKPNGGGALTSPPCTIRPRVKYYYQHAKYLSVFAVCVILSHD